MRRYTNADGTKKRGWMRAPNGQPTKLTERQWVQVRTPAFKEWFGDWEAAELLALAERAWSDKNFKGKFAFVPSGPLSRRLAELLGHPVQEIVITADSVRHMKSHHGDAMAEARRGQIVMTTEDALLLPYILNNFDDAVRVPDQDRPHGEKAVEIRKQINGVAIVATIEQGKDKQFVVSSWRKVSAASMQSGNTASPRPNVLNDADKSGIAKEIAEIKWAARKTRGTSPRMFKKNNQAKSGALFIPGNAGVSRLDARSVTAVLKSLDGTSVSNRPTVVKGAFDSVWRFPVVFDASEGVRMPALFRDGF